ncbi:hypothetical protein CL630_00325 [bacterium]|nr:hypothetical protein [bacterium]|tara:strand:+ start:585 stop:1334 length:750 start_codon:yes stop_codon:yes gene_type:complete
MLKQLQEFGLSENEAGVYLASLEIGKATADELSKHASVKRPTTYVQIESLVKKGLMSSIEENKKTFFVPESPEYLRRLFEKNHQELKQRGKELDQMLPGLARMFEHAGDRPRVRFFEGKEGLITMREEFLKVKNKEIFVIFSHDALLEVFSKEEIVMYSKKRADKGVKSHAVYTRKAGKFSETHSYIKGWRFIPEEKFLLGADMVIYDNKVALMAHRGKIMGVIIENKEIAKSMKAMYQMIWESAEKYQ